MILENSAASAPSTAFTSLLPMQGWDQLRVEQLSVIKRVVKKGTLRDRDEIRENLAYWLSKSPEERVAAVDFLRKQMHGTTGRLQRVARVIQRS